jgi:hypothetical protein
MELLFRVFGMFTLTEEDLFAFLYRIGRKMYVKAADLIMQELLAL